MAVNWRGKFMGKKTQFLIVIAPLRGKEITLSIDNECSE